jgi:hypothetical protein
VYVCIRSYTPLVTNDVHCATRHPVEAELWQTLIVRSSWSIFRYYHCKQGSVTKCFKVNASALLVLKDVLFCMFTILDLVAMMQGMLGVGTSAPQDSSKVSSTSVGQGKSTRWKLAALDGNTTCGIFFEVTAESSGDSSALQVCVHGKCLFFTTSSPGLSLT